MASVLSHPAATPTPTPSQNVQTPGVGILADMGRSVLRPYTGIASMRFVSY